MVCLEAAAQPGLSATETPSDTPVPPEPEEEAAPDSQAHILELRAHDASDARDCHLCSDACDSKLETDTVIEF